MFRNSLYYSIKPLVPQSVRLPIRRWLARRKRARVNEVWPILPGSERAPQAWPGWPDGKRFAFVISHDVERQAGVNRCRPLMQLEMSLGFRSSFNFVPEDEYTVSPELREELRRNGFEVGVHDLYHDGKLYSSRAEFARKAARINDYLKDWNAVGFRSGFMFHELDWLHDLDIQYDASTFDTDPFEPQPDGMGTIFPFWVPGPEGRGQAAAGGGREATSNSKPETRNSRERGYVELPYTLPQDFTLFLLFRERRPDIWFQKLEWIAQHGGMALVNVHPDYLRFAEEPDSPATYPVDFFTQLLEHVRSRYAGAYWQPLPREVASYVRR